jgi:hypothetical protein
VVPCSWTLLGTIGPRSTEGAQVPTRRQFDLLISATAAVTQPADSPYSIFSNVQLYDSFGTPLMTSMCSGARWYRQPRYPVCYPFR